MPFGSASAPSSNNPTPVFGASATQPAANPFGANSAAAKPAFNFGGAAAPAAFGAGGEILAVHINSFCAVVMYCEYGKLWELLVFNGDRVIPKVFLLCTELLYCDVVYISDQLYS